MKLAATVALVVWLLCPLAATAQELRGQVRDQTGLPLPGAEVTLRRTGGGRDVTTTDEAGMFVFDTAGASDRVVVSLDGFEPADVDVAAAAGVVLALAHASERTTVTASGLTPTGFGGPSLGTTITASEAASLPAAHPRMMAALPLLPSVIRGQDGLLRLDGARPHEGGLNVDGFDITDPVSGSTTIDLPLESVRGMTVLRDPMNVAFTGMLGGLAAVETVSGAATTVGVQGFVPRPRLSKEGFGQIEGFFPRAYAGGRRGAVRYFAEQEFDFERVAVPGVTASRRDPNVVEVSATSFVRTDLALSSRHALIIEGILVPGHTVHAGLSPLRLAAAAPRENRRDLFGGITERWIVDARDVVTVRFGVLAHDSGIATPDSTESRLTPGGWRDNWFAASNYRGARESLSVTWDRGGIRLAGTHTLSVGADLQRRSLRGGLQQRRILIEDADGALVRRLDFGGASRVRARDRQHGVAVGDQWTVNERVHIEVGTRVDQYGSRTVASPRVGLNYQVDAVGNTLLKVGAGRFAGRLPLHALAFGQLPGRTDTTFDAENQGSGRLQTSRVRGRLGLPVATTFTVELVQRLTPTVDMQVSARERHASRLATVSVPTGDDDVEVASSGRSTYRELQAALRKSWADRGQVFVSYVRSASSGEVNDFGTLFRGLAAAALDPAGRARSNDDVPHRLVAWGTVTLPRDVVVAPAVEWHSGFPYSPLDRYRRFDGSPNSVRFPAFFSLDLVGYKSVAVLARRVNLGVQVFNVTHHFNPREVMAVGSRSGPPRFVNSVGTTLGGYMMVKWD